MIPATMQFFFILALFSLVGLGLGRPRSQTCPAEYKRFSLQHTFCLAPNPSCQVRRTGVSKQDIDLILRVHNEFRSKVAMGKEGRAKGGTLPKAADMLQMVWDNELAAVAQKWTENCHWGHDCKECRAVENFAVGQNLAIEDYDFCPNCLDPSDEPAWEARITGLYDEVVDYHKNWLERHQDHSGPMTGHFTQVIWSKSWRVGCGYSFYKQGGSFHKYYACNYGPGGNVKESPVYKQGQPCTACPTNTVCSTANTGANSFPGLCKMVNPNTSPAYANDPGTIFFCGASSGDEDCEAEVSGDGTWYNVHSVGGNYDSIVLNGGQSATMTFLRPIVPKGERFCLALNFRKGPLDASNFDESSLLANFKMDYSRANPMNLDTGTTNFMGYSIDLGWGSKTKLSFTFSVPRGGGKHVLDMRKIEAYDGRCR